MGAEPWVDEHQLPAQPDEPDTRVVDSSFAQRTIYRNENASAAMPGGAEAVFAQTTTGPAWSGGGAGAPRLSMTITQHEVPEGYLLRDDWGGSVLLTYDDNGQVASSSDADGFVVRFGRGDKSRLTDVALTTVLIELDRTDGASGGGDKAFARVAAGTGATRSPTRSAGSRGRKCCAAAPSVGVTPAGRRRWCVLRPLPCGSRRDCRPTREIHPVLLDRQVLARGIGGIGCRRRTPERSMMRRVLPGPNSPIRGARHSSTSQATLGATRS